MRQRFLAISQGNEAPLSPRDREGTIDVGANRVELGDSHRQSRRSLCVFLLLSGCFTFSLEPALAQGIDASAPDISRHPSELHGPDELNRSHAPNKLNGIDDLNQKRHLTATGKPCIALESYATTQLINKKIYEHWIKASNICGQNVKIQVCYYKTNDCIIMNVPPWESENAILGIQPNMKEFQYEAKEK
jgi:hypothetical protein